MNTKTKKKGFTLVELLVVIAIIAVLATVSIVGYTAFIERANLSNDQTTIEMINDNLLAVTVDKEIETAGDALTYLREANIYGEKLMAYSDGHHYVFDLQNKIFVLVDEGGKIVYPENVKSPDLWALYSNKASDKVRGVTQYVATESVWYEADADKVFVGTGYTVDLNNFSWSADLNSTNTVTVINGYVEDGIDGVLLGDGAIKLEEITAIAPTDTLFENKIINNADVFDALKDSTVEEVTFSNCVIGATKVLIVGKNVSVDLVFENCVFTSSQTGWAIETNNDGDLTVKNCTFNGGRGINISSKDDVLIENNTFMVETHCMQLAGGGWDSVTIKDNNFVSGAGIARVHANLAGGGTSQGTHANGTACSACDDVYTGTPAMTLADLEQVSFTITGNTFSPNFNAVAYPDCIHVSHHARFITSKIAK